MSDIDDLDAELLGLAGSGESDDEGDNVDATQQIDDRSPSPEAPVKQSVEKSADSGPRRGVAQKVRAKRGKKRRQDDSEDEDAVA